MKKANLTLYVLALTTAAAIAWAYHTPIDVSIEARGIVRPEGDVVKVISDVSGRIRQVQLREGTQIHQGDALIQLDTHDLALKQRALESRIHATETHIQRLSQNDHLFQEGLELLNLYDQLEQSHLDIARRTITSPADGEISAVSALHPGEVLTAGTPIATIIPRDRNLVIESWLPASERAWVKEGQLVRAQPEEILSDQANTFDGLVVSISPDARVTESLAAYRVTLTPAPISPPLRAGMTFRIHFITHQERLLGLLFHRIRRGFK